MNIRDYNIFAFGYYCATTCVVLMFLYFQIGSVNMRVLLVISNILGFASIPLGNKIAKRFGRK